MKCLVLITVLIFVFFVPQFLLSQNAKPINKTPISKEVVKGCPENPDKQYDRLQILQQFADVLNDSQPESTRSPLRSIIKRETANGFAVWDLTDTSNRDVAFLGECIDFIDGHIYHFIYDYFPLSVSHIAILENGKLKVFKSLSCPEGRDDYKELIKYLEVKLKKDKNKDDIITRVKNFRRYHYYPPRDVYYYFCKENQTFSSNPDSIYKRQYTYEQFGGILYSFAPESYRRQTGLQVINDARALNFFVYDLTDPSNKQTTSLEQVDFINNHIYHFGYIDAPYSYSHIAILEDGKLKVFRGINCPNKGDSLDDLLAYLKVKLKDDKNKKKILKRVKDYRKYGVYVSFEGKTQLQCDDLESDDKKSDN